MVSILHLWIHYFSTKYDINNLVVKLAHIANQIMNLQIFSHSQNKYGPHKEMMVF